MIDPSPADVEGFLPLLTAAGEHATAAADPCIVEQEMNLVSVLLRSNVIAKPQDLSLTRHISDVRRNAQPLRQPVGLAELLRLRHCLGKDVAHRDIAAFNDQLPNKLSPHARATTGDDRDSARELLHRRPPF